MINLCPVKTRLVSIFTENSLVNEKCSVKDTDLSRFLRYFSDPEMTFPLDGNSVA